MMKNIVSQEWLLENMSREDLIVLDTRAELGDLEYGIKEYEKGHIEGARFVSVEDIMTGEVGAHGGRHPLPNMEKFIDDMKKLGIRDGSTVVIYDDGDLAMAGRLWWMLKYIGFPKAYVLDGGIKLWTEKGLPVTTEIRKVKEGDRLSLNIDHSILVDIDYVKKAMEKESTAIVDARAAERYRGEVEPLDRIPGHIPNALNFPWMKLVERGRSMSKEEATVYFQPLKDYEEIIVHCGSGITGTVNYIFMEEIGLKPKFYLGGYSDWVSYEDNVVIKG